jgi:transcriptional regulator with XRE-family HTH domain
MDADTVSARRSECAGGADPAGGGSFSALSLPELGEGLARLRPPPAYRLALDSGVEYNNVRRALSQPGRTRVATWCKLLRSLRLRMLAVQKDAAPAWCDPAGAGTGSDAPPPAPFDPACERALERCRRARGWSRRELARRAGVSIDTVVSLEQGRGLLGKLEQVCAALELRLVFRLPPGHVTLDALWRERAARCLEAPAQFPPPRQRTGAAAPPRRQAQISASIASAAASARNSARLIASAPTDRDAQAAPWACASPDSRLKAMSRNGT